MLTPPTPGGYNQHPTYAEKERDGVGHPEDIKVGQVLQGKELQTILKKYMKKENQLVELRKRVAAMEAEREARQVGLLSSQTAEREVIEDQQKRIRSLVIKAERLELKSKIMKDVMFKINAKRKEAKVKSGGKNQSLLYNFLVGPEESPSEKEIRLLQEVLQDKIRENEVIATMLHEAKTNHREKMAKLQENVGQAQATARLRHEDWLEATKKARRLNDEIQRIKEANDRIIASLKEELGRAKSDLSTHRLSTRKEIKSLTNRLQALSKRFETAVVFDDSPKPSYNAANLERFDRIYFTRLEGVLKAARHLTVNLKPLIQGLIGVYMEMAPMAHRRTLKGLLGEIGRGLDLTSLPLSQTLTSVSLEIHPGLPGKNPKKSKKKLKSRLFSSSCAALDSMSKLAFVMVQVLREIPRAGVTGNLGDGWEGGHGEGYEEVFRRLQSQLCAASDACSRLAKKETWREDGDSVIESLSESKYRNSLQDHLSCLSSILLELASFGGSAAATVVEKMWKLLNNFASSLDKLAQAMPTTRIANLGFQSRLRYTCRNYLDKLSQIQPIHAQEGGSIRASKIEEQLQILKAENKEKDHVIAHLEQKMKEQTLVQTPYTPSTGSYPSSFPGLKSKHLKLDDKTEGVKGRGREGVPNSVGEGMIRVDEVKEMEERYSKQVKLLGQSLHEMSGLYRQEKKRNSEQAETIHILRQQLEVARATNRKLTKEFAYQMRRATQISDTDNTPVRHAHALAEALASPAPRGVFLDDIVEDKNLKVFSSQDKTPITFSSKSPKDDQRRGTDEVRRKPPPPPPPNARGIKLKTRTVKT